ncbi:MAG: hypothetical protein M1167_06310 [Chloroflexi bacterium]|nr:hypothetical protein [Chloroflexota bacterium]
MGEKNAKEESILGELVKKEARFVKDICLSNVRNFTHLHSFSADTLKYVHSKAFGYDKCSFSPTRVAVLTVKSENGERKYV